MKKVPVILACVLAVSALAAQEKPVTPDPAKEKPATVARAAEQARPLIPLKVQIVLSRFKGEKKVSSLPYMLGVTANERGGKTSLRMGIEVPIGTKSQGFNYRNVGTNIDCFAESTVGDVFKLNLTVSDSSIHLDTTKPDSGSIPAIVGDVPAFRSFNSSFTVLLRDGQTTQYTSAVDPVSGEVMKIDVSLNVVK